jgi:formylglycine-generating enzyme required for sulfatase activity
MRRWTGATLVVLAGCVLQTETVSGPAGMKGAKGDKGEPGVVDTATVAMLQDTIAKLQARVDALEQAGKAEPECPAGGYARDTGVTGFVVCKRGADEVVKVGSGGSAFWIDRYEASVWDGSVQRFGADDDSNLGSTFMKNGQSSTPWAAKSVKGVAPATHVTWFQAQAACRANGKRLPTGEEWLAAARGTTDPPNDNDGSKNTRCNTKSPGPRPTGAAGDPGSTAQASGCFSDWGAEDMIGNVWEFAAEWYAGPSNSASAPPVAIWPNDGTSYGSDDTVGIASYAYATTSTGMMAGLPAAALRGGGPALGTGAGIFTLHIDAAPSDSNYAIGFRCVIPH